MTPPTPSHRPTRLVVFTGDVWEHVCPVVRITRPAEQAGLQAIHGVEWKPAPNEGRGKPETLPIIYPERIQEGDLVVIQRDFPVHRQAYESVMAEAHRLGKPVFYELDDLLPELPDDHPGAQRYLPTRLAILRALAEADAAIGSTPALCDYLRIFNPDVRLLPNYLDDQLWQIRPITQHTPSKPVVIGYLGSASHAHDLAMVVPALVRLLQRYGKNLVLRFWGIVPPKPLQDCGNVEWTQVGMVSYQEFAAYFQEQACDLVIAPLRNNLFNRCKSSIKFLEYSALGFPGVYSRLEPYTQVVDHGKNGFLASTLDEWETFLIELIEKPDLRVEFSLAAQETVRNSWLLSNHAQEFRQAYFLDQGMDRTRSGKPVEVRAAAEIARKAQIWQAELEKQNVEQSQTIIELTHQINELKIHLHGKEQAYQTAYQLYLEIMHSTGWKVMQRLFRLRQRLLPKGSRRERLVKLGFLSYQVLRREGVRAFLRAARRRMSTLLHRTASGGLAVATLPKSGAVILPGVLASLPAICVLVIQEKNGKYPGQEATINWLKKQTIPFAALELVTWERDSVPFRQVLNTIKSRYLCLASNDLLNQSATYLEENWIALETGSFAFTVNLHGLSLGPGGGLEWAEARLSEGFLPGNREQPLLRQVVNTACLAEVPSRLDDLSLDLSTWLSGRGDMPRCVGKVIVHASQSADVEGMLPFDNRLPPGEWQKQGSHLLVRQAGSPPLAGEELAYPIQRVLHPLETVLPAEVPLSQLPPENNAEIDKPTVILALQYLAIGGAEQLALHIINGLKDKIRFVVIAVDAMEPELGTLAETFRLATPYVYNLPGFLDLELRSSFFKYLVERYHPVTWYIANGADILYDTLRELKQHFPHLRTVNQVYDSQVGWINRYNVDLVIHMDAHIGANYKICQAYQEKGARPETIFQIAHAVDVSHLHPEAYSPARKQEIRLRFGLPAGCKVVTFAARMNPQKRPMDFVELARRFSTGSTLPHGSTPSADATDEFSRRVVFLMIGEGVLTPIVDSEIQRIGLKNIFRHPFYRPISDVLAITDVLVLPSEYEGMPLIVSEAQAMGKPVVVTDVGNNRDVLAVTHGGVVISQIGAIQELVDGVKQMLAQPPDPDQTRQAILENFGVEVIAEKYREVFLREV